MKTLRKLKLAEMVTLTLLAQRMRVEIDGDLGDLVDRVAMGDDSALVPAVDRLIELGREDQAARLKSIAGV